MKVGVLVESYFESGRAGGIALSEWESYGNCTFRVRELEESRFDSWRKVGSAF